MYSKKKINCCSLVKRIHPSLRIIINRSGFHSHSRIIFLRWIICFFLLLLSLSSVHLLSVHEQRSENLRLSYIQILIFVHILSWSFEKFHYLWTLFCLRRFRRGLLGRINLGYRHPFKFAVLFISHLLWLINESSSPRISSKHRDGFRFLNFSRIDDFIFWIPVSLYSCSLVCLIQSNGPHFAIKSCFTIYVQIVLFELFWIFTDL